MFLFCHQKPKKTKTKTKRDKLCMKLLGLHLSPYFLLNFLSNLYISPLLWKFSNLLKITIPGRCTCKSKYWSRYFYSMVPPLHPIPPIAPVVRTLLQVLSSPLRWPWLWILGYLYFIWFVIFSNVMTLQFRKQNMYHIAW